MLQRQILKFMYTTHQQIHNHHLKEHTFRVKLEKKILTTDFTGLINKNFYVHTSLSIMLLGTC